MKNETWRTSLLQTQMLMGAFGDNDTGDFVEIGESHEKVGKFLRVNPLAALAMIDEGELDWKIIEISVDDPRASIVKDIGDVELFSQQLGIGLETTRSRWKTVQQIWAREQGSE